jgi:hypothetical protein
MDHETAFLLAVYLLPLGLVSFASAWAENRRPYVGAVLWVGAAGLFVYVLQTRPEGLFALSEIPDLTIQLVARVIAIF